MTEQRARRTLEHGAPHEERVRALKERVYATFTGLAIVAALALSGGHGEASDAFFALLAGIGGISAAGFVAEIVAFQVGNGQLPDLAELRTMLRIAFGALGSASVPLIVLAAAWIGWIDLELALRIAIGLYFVTLAAISLIAAWRTRLSWPQRLISLAVILGLGALTVLILVIAH